MASVKVEGSSDADQSGARKIRSVVIHPLLLFRSTDADEHDVGIGLENALSDFGLLGLVRGPKGRSIGTGDHQAGEALLQTGGQMRESVPAAAVQEDAVVVNRSTAAEFEHESRAVDSLLLGRSERAEGPDDGHAVRGGNVSGVKDFGESGIIVSSNDSVDRSNADVMCVKVRRFRALRGPTAAQFHHFAITRLADTDADDRLFGR